MSSRLTFIVVYLSASLSLLGQSLYFDQTNAGAGVQGSGVKVHYAIGDVVSGYMQSSAVQLIHTPHGLLVFALPTDTEEFSTVRIYPNPVNHVMTLEIADDKVQYMRIFSLKGETMYDGDVRTQVDFTTYSAGLYVLILYTSDHAELSRFKILKI